MKHYNNDKRKIEDLLQEVIKEARKLGVPISENIDAEISINHRAKSRFACCRQTKLIVGYSYTIEVSDLLFQCRERDIREILAHEVLHTCKGCQNHGVRWKAYAEKMNKRYGYHIKRTATYEELGLAGSYSQKNIKYRVTCQSCGKIFERQRKSKLVTNTKQYRCSCGGNLICEDISKNKKKSAT